MANHIANLLSTIIVLILSQTTIATEQQHSIQNNLEVAKFSFNSVVQKAAPAVVDLVVTQVENNTIFNPFFSDPFFKFFLKDDLLNNTPSILSSSGSGVIISSDGILVTCAHVVKEDAKIIVILQDGRELAANIIKIDSKSDLAFLQISLEKDEKLPFLKLGDSEALKVGDVVLAIGNSFGLGQTVTEGIISAKARVVLGDKYLIQTSAAINPGNSGGALINLDGELIGINNAIISKSGGSHGVGFAIPGQLVVAKSNINAKAPWLGISVQSISPELAQSIPNYKEKKVIGVLVTRIHEKSPANAAGLKQGDIILKFNQHEIKTQEEFDFYQQTSSINKDITLNILRDGKKSEIHCIPIEAPGDENILIFDKGLLKGLSIGEASPALAQKYNFDERINGIVVLAAKTPQGIFPRFVPGDVIININNTEIHTLKDAEEALKKLDEDKGVTILLRRGAQKIELFISNHSTSLRTIF